MLDLTNVQVYLPIVVGVILPAVVALVTKQLATSKFKSLVLVGLSAVSSVIVPLIGATTYDIKAIINNFLVIFGTGVLSYYGLLKPQGVTEKIQSATPNFGAGSVDLPELDELEDVEYVGDDVVDGPTLEG